LKKVLFDKDPDPHFPESEDTDETKFQDTDVENLIEIGHTAKMSYTTLIMFQIKICCKDSAVFENPTY